MLVKHFGVFDCTLERGGGNERARSSGRSFTKHRWSPVPSHLCRALNHTWSSPPEPALRQGKGGAMQSKQQSSARGTRSQGGPPLGRGDREASQNTCSQLRVTTRRSPAHGRAAGAGEVRGGGLGRARCWRDKVPWHLESSSARPGEVGDKTAGTSSLGRAGGATGGL